MRPKSRFDPITKRKPAPVTIYREESEWGTRQTYSHDVYQQWVALAHESVYIKFRIGTVTWEDVVLDE